jgi:hypothetical protein
MYIAVFEAAIDDVAAVTQKHGSDAGFYIEPSRLVRFLI